METNYHFIYRYTEKTIIYLTHHFEGLFGPEQVEHGLQVLLYVASCRGDAPGRPGALVRRQHQCRAFSREIAFAQAATRQKKAWQLVLELTLYKTMSGIE